MTKRAVEVAPGDVLLLEGERVLVLDEPVLMHRGLGLFDELELLVGVTVAGLSGVPRRFAWTPTMCLDVSAAP
ncbi:MAG: hypothetical protein M3022_10665 [Actinomycetota bacterium]|nr:hypothetical protein [Actinomycetota bacterium]